jgi:hypothetical protein
MSIRFLPSFALSAASALTLTLAVPAYACDGDCHSAKKATTTASAAKGVPATASAKCECEKGGKNCTCPKGQCECANCGKGKKGA